MVRSVLDRSTTQVFAVDGEVYIKARGGSDNDPVSGTAPALANAPGFAGWNHVGMLDGENGINISITSNLHKVVPSNAEAWVKAFGASREVSVTANLLQNSQESFQRAITSATQTDGTSAGTNADQVKFGGDFINAATTDISLMIVTRNDAAEEGLIFFFPLAQVEGDVAIPINKDTDRIIPITFTVGEDIGRTAGETVCKIYQVTAVAAVSTFMTAGIDDATSGAALTTNDSSAFLAAGNLTISPGQTDEDAGLAYASHDGTVFTLTDPTTEAHSAGSVVIQAP